MFSSTAAPDVIGALLVTASKPGRFAKTSRQARPRKASRRVPTLTLVHLPPSRILKFRKPLDEGPLACTVFYFLLERVKRQKRALEGI